jgi:prepilin signal peptidase PulO-like enzyme (type II secretory pathway)
MYLLALLFFIFGAIFASFIGVVVARLNTGQSFLAGRSRCDACGAPLPPLALMPVFSFIVLGGRARCCGARIPLLAPVAELILGGLFALAYLSVGITLALPFLLLSLALLLALVLYDLAHQILPPVLLGAFVVAAAAAGFLSAPSTDAFISSCTTALLIAASLALIHYLSGGRAMGFSDAPLSLGLALLVGPAALAGFIFSFWIGAVVGIVILAGRPAGSRMGVEVPFAPYLAAGFILAYFTQWNPFAFIAASL